MSHQLIVRPGTACATGVKVQQTVSLRGAGDITVLFQADVAGVLFIQPLRPSASPRGAGPRTPYSEDLDDDGVPETWPDLAASETVVADTPMTLMLANFGFNDVLVGFRPADDGVIDFFDVAILSV